MVGAVGTVGARKADPQCLLDVIDGIVLRRGALGRTGPWSDVDRSVQGGAIDGVLQGALIDEDSPTVDRQGGHREQGDGRHGKDNQHLPTAATTETHHHGYSVSIDEVPTM